jgi:hypothetical protein
VIKAGVRAGLGVAQKAWTGWSRWAFAPADTAPMAALRIAVGLLTIGWTLSLLPDARTFLDPSGVQHGLPHYDSGAWAVQLGPPYLVLLVLLAAAAALTVGWRTRVVSVVVALLLLVIQRRDPWILNSGDLLLRELAFFVMLMPAGETWSLDARRRRAAGGVERMRAPWALRLVQLQISSLYLFSVWAKVRGVDWNDGTAVGIALQLEDLQRFTLPAALSTSLLVSAVLTYSSLAVEASLAFGLWLPRLRYWVMASGVGLHLGIEASLLIGFFSLAVISSYLAFVPPEHLRALVAKVQVLRAARAAPASARDPVPLRSS